jgi:hypothetical protein
MKNFFKQYTTLLWAIGATVGWLCQFLFGSDTYWESKRVTLEVSRGLIEFHQKKAAILEDLVRPEMVNAPNDSPMWTVKLDYLNAIEKNIAQLEGRKPVDYARPSAVTNFRVE